MAMARGPVPACFSEIDNTKLPKHVAMIMDGNGRWAQERGKGRSHGHRAGMERMVNIVRVSSLIGIDVLSLFAFSTENWKRPKEEVDLLFLLLVEFIRREIQELHRNNVLLKIQGDITKLPNAARDAVIAGMELTKNNTGMVLNIALNYGSRTEIVSAARQIAQLVQAGKLSLDEIDESLFSSYLSTAGLPDPDLVIRTSGEKRLSNYMMYQVAYAELSFQDCYWPDFTDALYARCLMDYCGRERRYGGIKGEGTK